MLITMAFGLIVGLPSLRLRADYFAIVTIAMAEVVRLVAQNARGLTGGNEGLFCETEGVNQVCFDDTWLDVSDSILGFFENFWSDPETLLPLLLVVWVTVGARHRRPRLHPANAVGEGAAGGPRGRGRRPRSGQEHPPLQASVAGDLRRCWARWPASSSPSSSPRSTRTTTSRWSPSSPTGCWSSAASPTTGGSRSARSSSGRCSRRPASSSCRSADETAGGAALRDRRPGADPADGVPPAGDVRQAGGDGPWRLRPLLDVEGVVKRFGGIHAVDGATLEVRDGEIAALIGPNGAGKTTLFNVITGFYRGDRGSVTFGGEQIFQRPPHEIARRGMVRTFQITKALAAMPVIDNMMLAAPDQPGERLSGVIFRPAASRRREAEVREQALELLELFNLAKLADDYAGTLSGGQRKLLELARALMARPKLLLLDEPMAGINPTLGRRLLDHMQRLRREEGGDLPLHRARHGGGDEPLRPGDRDGRGPGDRRRRAATRCAPTRR